MCVNVLYLPFGVISRLTLFGLNLGPEYSVNIDSGSGFSVGLAFNIDCNMSMHKYTHRTVTSMRSANK